MKRTIVTIDESKCNGCGICVTACAEGALKIVDGKARLVSNRFCDGFGDCVGVCPTGALKVETREADDYDASATRDHVRQEKGITGLQKFEAAARRHSAPALHQDTAHKGCLGSRMHWSPAATDASLITPSPIGGGGIGQAFRSDLTQWPVQLHLVPANAPFFKGRELVVLSTCSPIASADAHWRFIRGRGIGCCLSETGSDGRLRGQVGRHSIGAIHTGSHCGADGCSMLWRLDNHGQTGSGQNGAIRSKAVGNDCRSGWRHSVNVTALSVTAKLTIRLRLGRDLHNMSISLMVVAVKHT